MRIPLGFGEFVLRQPPFRHGFAVPPPLKGRLGALPRQCVKLQFAPQYWSRGPMEVSLFDAVRDELSAGTARQTTIYKHESDGGK